MQKNFSDLALCFVASHPITPFKANICETHKPTNLFAFLLKLSFCETFETFAIWEMKQEGTFNVAREWRTDFLQSGGQ